MDDGELWIEGGSRDEELSPVCLIVDDEPAILRLVSIVLREMGCDTLTAPDAEVALEILKGTSPDLLISDVKLPGMDGVELSRTVKADANLSIMPVLLMSAYGEPKAHSGDDFIGKPFDIDGLADFVAPYLEPAPA